MSNLNVKSLIKESSENLAKEFHYGVHSTLSNMFGIKPEPLPYKIEEECRSTHGDVFGVITLSQDTPEGTVIVSFPRETICAMLSKMYRKELTQIDRSVQLGVGELTNIIYGVVKANMNKNGYAFKMAIPSVVLDEKNTRPNVGSGPTLVMPFMTSSGGFSVIVTCHLEEVAA